MISVIIPTRSLNDFILKENLPALAKQTYRDFEAIVLPNEESSQDKPLMNQYPWLTILPTHEITRPAKKRDIGSAQAKGDILAFIDDDAFARHDWLANAAAFFFKNPQASALCGPGVLPKYSKFWERVFDAVLCTYVGSGGYAYRFKQENARAVDDYPSMNFLVKKSVFEEIGGFNSEYWPGEDSKLCEDIVYKLNGTITYEPSVIVYHHRRNNLVHFLKQHGNYGYHRGAFFAHGDKNSRRVTYLIPSFFVLYLAFFPTIVKSVPFAMYPLYAYSLALLSVFFGVIIKTKQVIPSLTAVFVVVAMHITYGIRFIQGYLIGKTKKGNIY